MISVTCHGRPAHTYCCYCYYQSCYDHYVRYMTLISMELRCPPSVTGGQGGSTAPCAPLMRPWAGKSTAQRIEERRTGLFGSPLKGFQARAAHTAVEAKQGVGKAEAVRGCAFPKSTKATAVPSSKVAKFTRILLYHIHILIRNIYIHIYRANTKIKLGAWVAGREGRTDETTPEVQFAKPRERLEAAGQGDCSVAGDEVSAAGRIPPPQECNSI
jgi:hypothetical protein